MTATSSSPLMRTARCCWAARGSAGPSVVLLRHVSELPWPVHLSLLVDNLPAVAEDLKAGAVVSLSPTRLAVRRLPIVGL